MLGFDERRGERMTEKKNCKRFGNIGKSGKSRNIEENEENRRNKNEIGIKERKNDDR